MNSYCDKMKDQIADFITGVLPQTQVQRLQQHLGKCSACRDYAQALQEEEQLLTGLFGKFDASMPGREGEVINAINDLEAWRRTNIISVVGAIMKTTLAKHAAAAAVIVVVALYFVVTLTWISQITECIRLSM